MENYYPLSLPDLKTLKVGLDAMQEDVQGAMEEEPALVPQGEFILELIKILQDEVASIKTPNKIERKTEISIIAHLHLVYDLLDEMFMDEEDEDDNYDFDSIDEEEMTEEEK